MPLSSNSPSVRILTPTPPPHLTANMSIHGTNKAKSVRRTQSSIHNPPLSIRSLSPSFDHHTGRRSPDLLMSPTLSPRALRCPACMELHSPNDEVCQEYQINKKDTEKLIQQQKQRNSDKYRSPFNSSNHQKENDMHTSEQERAQKNQLQNPNDFSPSPSQPFERTYTHPPTLPQQNYSGSEISPPQHRNSYPTNNYSSSPILSNLESELNTTYHQLVNMTDAYNRLKHQHFSLQTHYTELQHSLVQSKQQNNHSLQQLTVQNKNEKFNSQQQIFQLATELNKLKKSYSDKESNFLSQINQLRHQNNKLQEKNNELDNEVKEANQLTLNMQLSLTDLTQEYHNSKNNWADKETNYINSKELLLEEMNRCVEIVKSTERDLQVESTVLQARKMKEEEKTEMMVKLINNLKTEKEELINDINNHKNANYILDKEYQSYRRQMSDSQEESKRKIKELERKFDSLEGEIHDLHSERTTTGYLHDRTVNKLMEEIKELNNKFIQENKSNENKINEINKSNDNKIIEFNNQLNDTIFISKEQINKLNKSMNDILLEHKLIVENLKNEYQENIMKKDKKHQIVVNNYLNEISSYKRNDKAKRDEIIELIILIEGLKKQSNYEINEKNRYKNQLNREELIRHRLRGNIDDQYQEWRDNNYDNPYQSNKENDYHNASFIDSSETREGESYDNDTNYNNSYESTDTDTDTSNYDVSITTNTYSNTEKHKEEYKDFDPVTSIKRPTTSPHHYELKDSLINAETSIHLVTNGDIHLTNKNPPHSNKSNLIQTSHYPSPSNSVRSGNANIQQIHIRL